MNKSHVRKPDYSGLLNSAAVSREYWKGVYKTLNDKYHFGANAYELISYVARKPGCKQDDMCVDLCIDKGCVAKEIFILVEEGYIERKRSTSDRRAYELTLSPTGRKVTKELKKFTDEWNEMMFDQVDQADKDTFMTVLSQISSKANKID